MARPFNYRIVPSEKGNDHVSHYIEFMPPWTDRWFTISSWSTLEAAKLAHKWYLEHPIADVVGKISKKDQSSDKPAKSTHT